MTYERIVPVVGGSTSPGKAYHAIPGVDGPAHRNDTEARIAHIVNHYDPAGKIGATGATGNLDQKLEGPLPCPEVREI